MPKDSKNITDGRQTPLVLGRKPELPQRPLSYIIPAKANSQEPKQVLRVDRSHSCEDYVFYKFQSKSCEEENGKEPD